VSDFDLAITKIRLILTAGKLLTMIMVTLLFLKLFAAIQNLKMPRGSARMTQ